MITAIVLYDLPDTIGLEECREHFTKIAPDFLKAKGFLRKQFICRKEGGIAGGVYMWETQADAEAFYSGPWRDGIRARYGNDPKIQYFETVALTDKASGKAGAILKIGHFLPEAEMQRRERQQPRFTVSSPVRTRRRAMNARSHLPGGRVTPKPNPNQQVFVGVIL